MVSHREMIHLVQSFKHLTFQITNLQKPRKKKGGRQEQMQAEVLQQTGGFLP